MYVPPGRRDNGANPHAHEFVPGGYQGAQQATAYDPRGASQQQPQQQFYAAAQQQPAQHQVHYAAAGQTAYYQPAQQAGAGQQQAYAYAAPATAGHQAQAPAQQAPTAAVSHQHQDPNAGQPRLFFGQQGGHHGGGGYGGHHGGGGYGGHHGGGGYGGHHGGAAGGFGGHPGVGGNGFGGFFSQGHRQQFTQDPFHGLPATQQHVREDRPDDQLFQDHAQGINFDLYDNIQVTVKPNNITPAESFQAMSLHPLLVENIARCRYEKPTPVQKNGIPIVVAGADLMACAQTGSGKTAAYLLPAVHFCLTKGTFPSQTRQATPTALIMAPTRELCVQIYDEGRKFTFRTGMRCVVVYGGADARQQMYELQRGCSILVATPGRLWEMFQRNVVSFRAIQFLVLDEADRMLDMGFEPQIRAIVEGAETDMPRTGSRQTLMYSATFPRDIQTLAREFLSQHYFLQVGRVGSTTENITQEVAWVEDYEKKERLLQYIQQFQDHLTLIFVEKKRDADYIERFLQQCHLPATSIHGDRVQREREEALAMFRSGMCRILVATDVASRGLDIPDVGVVIQYDLPTNIEDYVHRIGRTGRAGKRGSAVAFFCEKNRSLAEDLSTLLTEAHQVVPDFITAMVPPKHHHHHHNHRGGGGFRGRGGGRGGFRGGQRGGFSGFRGGQQRAPFQPAPQ